MVYTINLVNQDTGTTKAVKFYAGSLEEAIEHFRSVVCARKKKNKLQVQIPEQIRRKLNTDDR